MENAIKKAIEGGYKPNWNITKINEFPELYDRALLDPLFWQALGKQQGWGGYQCCNCGYQHFSKTGEVRIGFSECCQYWSSSKTREQWLYHWHNFIDHIALGGSIDDFFNNLIK